MIELTIMASAQLNPSQIFEATTEPTHHQTVDAYIHRDQQFKLVPSEVVAKAMTKLGYSNEALTKWQYAHIKLHMHKAVDDFVSNCNGDPGITMEELYFNANTEKTFTKHTTDTKNRQSDLQPLVDAVESGDIGETAFHRLRDFYTALTMSELACLGC